MCHQTFDEKCTPSGATKTGEVWRALSFKGGVINRNILNTGFNKKKSTHTHKVGRGKSIERLAIMASSRPVTAGFDEARRARTHRDNAGNKPVYKLCKDGGGRLYQLGKYSQTWSVSALAVPLSLGGNMKYLSDGGGLEAIQTISRIVYLSFGIAE